MPLINDRDLLLLEPQLFIGGELAATVLRNVTDGVVSGTTITSASSNFTSLAIDFGHAGSIDDLPCEVVSRISSTQLSVSAPRAGTGDPLIEFAAGGSQRLKIVSFKRLIDVAESWVLGALGLDADDPMQPLETSAILNLEAVKHLIAVRTIQQGYAAAAALGPGDASLKERAAFYAVQLDSAKRSTEIYLDLDGDGKADCVRRLDSITFLRM
jgi:hypothetical protein